MLNYNICGNPNGELLVFINGAGLSTWMWYKQLEFFKDYKIITFDLTGHGANCSQEFSTIKDLANDISKIIVAEGKNALLVGHSIGAQATLEMLRSYPHLINKAVVVSALNKDMGFKKTTLKMISLSYPLIKSKLFSKLQFNQLKLPQILFEKYFDNTLTISKSSLLNLTKDNMDFCFSQETDKANKLIYGEKEIKAMRDSAEILSKLFDTEVTYLKGGHGVPYVDESFNTIVKSFFEGGTHND